MKSYSLKHVADQALLHDSAALNARVGGAIADLLAHLAEIDERKLYLGDAYPSMFLYCVRELHMSENTALKRIQVARIAREFPAIFPALADGRVNLTAVLRLKPRLTADTVEELLAAATHKTKAEVEEMLAERFPRPDVPTLVRALAPPGELVPEPVGASATQLVPEPVGTPPEASSRARVAPLSADRYALQVTIDRATREQLRYAQALLGHTLPTGDVAMVLTLALRTLIETLERRKFGRGVRSRPRNGSPKGRYIPARVRSAVWQRDAGQCTFVSDGGKRCEARDRLEFDHVEPVAQCGRATIDNMRLRCRAHNQYTAECAFGFGFMHEKRQAARRRAAARAQVPARSESAPQPASDLEVIHWLQQLGLSATEARCESELSAHLLDGPLEQRGLG